MSNVDRGSMSLAMTAAVLVVAFLGVAVASLSVVYATGVQAANGADAAALAAAVATYPSAGRSSPALAASQIAEQNGTSLVRCLCPTNDSLHTRVVEVEVVVTADVPIFGEVAVSRRARAEFDPMAWIGR